MAFNTVGLKRSFDIAKDTANFLQSSEQNYRNMVLAQQQRDMLVAEKKRQDDMTSYTAQMEYLQNRDNIINHYNEGRENELSDMVNSVNAIAKQYNLPSVYSLKSIVYNTYMKDYQDAHNKWMPLYYQRKIGEADLEQKAFSNRWHNGKFNWLFSEVADQKKLEFEQNKMQQIANLQANQQGAIQNKENYNNELNNINNNNDYYNNDETYNAIKNKVNDKYAMSQASGIQGAEKQKYLQKLNDPNLSAKEKDAIYNKLGVAFGGKVNNYDLTNVATGDALNKYVADDKQRRIGELNQKYGLVDLSNEKINEYFDNNIKQYEDQISQVSSLVPDLGTGIDILMKNERDAGLKIGDTNWEMQNNIYDMFYTVAPAEFWEATPEQRQKMLPQVLKQLNTAPDSAKEKLLQDTNLLTMTELPAQAYKIMAISNDFKEQGIKISQEELKLNASAMDMFMDSCQDYLKTVNYATTENDIGNFINSMYETISSIFKQSGISFTNFNGLANSMIKILNSVRQVALEEKEINDIKDGLATELTKANILKINTDVALSKDQMNLAWWEVMHPKPNGNNGNNGGNGNNGDTIQKQTAIGDYFIDNNNDIREIAGNHNKVDFGNFLNNIPTSITKQDILYALNGTGKSIGQLKTLYKRDGSFDMDKFARLVIIGRNGQPNVKGANGNFMSKFDDMKLKDEIVQHLISLGYKGDNLSSKFTKDYIVEYGLKNNWGDEYELNVLADRLLALNGNKPSYDNNNNSNSPVGKYSKG